MKDLYCTELRTLWAFVASFKIRATGFAEDPHIAWGDVRVLLDTKFRRLPVVDDAGKLVSWCSLTNSSCLGRTIMSCLPQA
jgi:hypothetical protein